MTINRRTIAVGGAVAAAAALLYVYDPASAPFYPSCPLRALTGLLCPLCGGLRAAHALLHGRLFEAAALNPFLFAAGFAWPVVPPRWTALGAVLFMAARNLW
jgi:uncharacterized protein DUF2752